MAGLSRLFAPREREFFDLFEEAGNNIVRAAGMLETMLVTPIDREDIYNLASGERQLRLVRGGSRKAAPRGERNVGESRVDPNYSGQLP